jgi:hypothetical protein
MMEKTILPKKEINYIKTINEFELHSTFGFLGGMVSRGCILSADAQLLRAVK